MFQHYFITLPNFMRQLTVGTAPAVSETTTTAMATDFEKRKSPRAYWHDYAGGLYFVTVVTHERRHFFGEISNDFMHLNAIGSFLNQQIQELTSHHHYAQPLKHVVMPNHLHLILQINQDELPHNLRETIDTNEANNNIDFARRNIGWLSVVVGGIKSSVSRFAHLSDSNFKWQGRYHDHIIRNRDEFLKISDYIDNNVFTWNQDCFYAPTVETAPSMSNSNGIVGTAPAVSTNSHSGQGRPCPYIHLN